MRESTCSVSQVDFKKLLGGFHPPNENQWSLQTYCVQSRSFKKLFKSSQIEWLAHLIINTSAVGALATH